MPELPKGVMQPTGFTEFGLDAIGHNVFFGFKFQGDRPITFAVSHGGLAEFILYLQRIADEAQQRRLSLDPSPAHKEVCGKPDSPVRRIEVLPDIEGRNALVESTNADGTGGSFQLPFSLVEKLQIQLSSVIPQMKKLQAQNRGAH
jgi:hypothetical protein